MTLDRGINSTEMKSWSFKFNIVQDNMRIIVHVLEYVIAFYILIDSITDKINLFYKKVEVLAVAQLAKLR